jgi:hypothetical protein
MYSGMEHENRLTEKKSANLAQHAGRSHDAALIDLNFLLVMLSNHEYASTPSQIFTSSIGQQTRHILDYINIFLNSLTSDVIEYNQRDTVIVYLQAIR